MLLILDNHDSFTYNLYQALAAHYDGPVQVIKSDEIDLEGIEALRPSGLVLSPGPGRPETAGICPEAVLRFSGQVPILGICLGMQVIGQVFGAQIAPAPTLCHGHIDTIEHLCDPLFEGVAGRFTAVRYHSLAVTLKVADEAKTADEVNASAKDCASAVPLKPLAYSTRDRALMALRHRDHTTLGLQFHPESFGTLEGAKILSNFADLVAAHRTAEFILGGEATEAEIRAALLAYPVAQLSGTTLESFASSLRRRAAVPPEAHAFAERHRLKGLIDVCGTGGDGLKTINISSLTAIVLARAGVPVAKHGNRAITGLMGSMDLLQILHDVHVPVAKNLHILPAQQLHPSMKDIAPVRHSIPHPTLFNFVGPLANPLPIQAQLLGVYLPTAVASMAQALVARGVHRAFVFSGYGGMDELSLEGPNTGLLIEDGNLHPFVIDPAELGIALVPNRAYSVRTQDEAVERAEMVLANKPPRTEAVITARDTVAQAGRTLRDRQIVALNAGTALWLIQHPLCPTLQDGYRYALTIMGEQ